MRIPIALFACLVLASPLYGQQNVEPAPLPEPAAAEVPDLDALETVNSILDSAPAPGCDIGDCGCDGCCDSLPFDDCSDFRLNGWINAGFIYNTDAPTSDFNGPYNAVDRSNEGMLNQIYLSGEKVLPLCGMGIGGRVDFLYGEDYFLAESIGLEKRPDGSAHWNPEYYGFALPQAYATLGNQDTNIQVGHFYSIVGYEGLMSPDNFFYSKSYSYQFAGPFTHWGGQANMRINDRWSTQVGVHNGWDALDRTSDKLGYIGKVRYDHCETGAWSSFAVTTGDDSNSAVAGAYSNRTRYSWIVSVPLSCKTEYVFHHWLGFQKNGAADGSTSKWYGIDQYLYYTINDCMKAGLRFEWFRDQEGTRVGLNRPSNPNVPPFAGNFYSLSLGLNWKPRENIVLRPEIRGDWYDGGPTRPFDDGNSNSQYTLGFDAIFTL